VVLGPENVGSPKKSVKKPKIPNAVPWNWAKYIYDAILIVYVTVIFLKPSDICYKIYNHVYQNTPSQTL
jgi:hypothetical protein